MIFAVEGIDGAGKSAVAEYLRVVTGAPVFRDPLRTMAHFERSAEEWVITGKQCAADTAFFAKHMTFLADRWCVSSLAYDRMRNRRVDEEFFARIAAETPNYVLMVDTPVAVALDRQKERGTGVRFNYEFGRELRELYLRAMTDWLMWGGKGAIVDGTLPFDEINFVASTHFTAATVEGFELRTDGTG